MTHQQLKKKTEGFTIIEVLIVLAIAGLIMLIVFLAVPQLQRTQRNNARSNDVSRIAAAITECLANRNGVKTSCDTLAEINAGNLTQLGWTGTATDNPATNMGAGTTTNVVVGFQRGCNPAGSDDQAGSLREFAITYVVEPAINRCISS